MQPFYYQETGRDGLRVVQFVGLTQVLSSSFLQYFQIITFKEGWTTGHAEFFRFFRTLYK